MNKTNSLLKKFARSRKYEAYADLKVSHKGEEHNFDSLLIGEFGVLLIESFKDSGELYGNATDENFINITTKNQRVLCENLSKKLSKNTAVLREIVTENKIYNVKIEGAIVIENKNCKQMLTVPDNIFSLKELKKYLESEKFDDGKADKAALINMINNKKYR